MTSQPKPDMKYFSESETKKYVRVPVSGQNNKNIKGAKPIPDYE